MLIGLDFGLNYYPVESIVSALSNYHVYLLLSKNSQLKLNSITVTLI